MDENLQITINGRRLSVPPGTLLAAAIAQAGVTRFRRSVLGQPRGPFCGMGTCMECRVTINGQAHFRSCQILCAADMDIKTDE
jgi:sarcosine oxidase subunit alpha